MNRVMRKEKIEQLIQRTEISKDKAIIYKFYRVLGDNLCQKKE
jgi:hypothetical protein